MISGRLLGRDDLKEIWSIDRSEVIDAVYHLEHGGLVLKPEHYEMQGWWQNEIENYTHVLEACFNRGGWFYGLFDDRRLIGVVVLDSRAIGKNQDQLQLVFLHISCAYRNRGMGKQLFGLATGEARRRGARWLYISATPSERTVGFYLGLGCKVTAEPDQELFAQEPEDIHMECEVT